MMSSLLLTLGHNSSAVLVEGDRVVWGYETERLSGLKSDSRFPSVVLDRFLNRRPDRVYVTHWAPTGALCDMSEKHWVPRAFDGVPILSHTPDLSHHDTHLYGALSYAGRGFPRGKSSYGLVVDGFGTLGEHISLYRLHEHGPQLIDRIRGYDTSLGLWYQYATAFMGMKMHEDEYKLLGYEVHVSEDDALKLGPMINAAVDDWADRVGRSTYRSEYDPVYAIDALPHTKQRIFDHLIGVCKAMGIDDPTTFEARCILAYYVQTVLERCVMSFVLPHDPHHLLLAGGVFYNVKLNLELVNSIRGSLCVYPLAGDQGNAIGLYSALNSGFEFPSDLFWGHRTLHNVGEVDGLVYFKSESEATDFVIRTLRGLGRVNVVRGSMEFGPRALCNTSTLARPTVAQVEAINQANDRNTVMPMAPVMTPARFFDMFEPSARRVWRSTEHMVVAAEHVEYPDASIEGISHKYTFPITRHTSRPQVTHDPWMLELLRHFGGVLINTSFNYHGRPIAYDMPSVIDNHRLERARDPSTTTVVITNA